MKIYNALALTVSTYPSTVNLRGIFYIYAHIFVNWLYILIIEISLSKYCLYIIKYKRILWYFSKTHSKRKVFYRCIPDCEGFKYIFPIESFLFFNLNHYTYNFFSKTRFPWIWIAYGEIQSSDLCPILVHVLQSLTR